MASEVYSIVEVELQDETVVELRPLPIAKLRKFMRLWQTHVRGVSEAFEERGEEMIADPDLNDQQYDVYIKLVAIALERQLKDTKTDKQFIAYLEDVVDEPTIFKILDVCGGLKLGDRETPNLQTEA